MKRAPLIIPGALLLDRSLSGSAKLLWMVLELRAHGERLSRGALAARAGLAMHTVRRGLAQLEDAGWLSGSGGGSKQAWVSVPAPLLLRSEVRTQGKLLYGMLQLLPGFMRARGQFTYAQLSELAGVGPTAVKEAIADLNSHGWLLVVQKNKLSPVKFELRNPVAEQGEAERLELEERLKELSFRGEVLMREYLNLIVDSDEFEDNATPGFLVNPFTGQELQYDRYYPPGVAFEFQGAQHDGPTERFPSEDAAWKQQGRDLIKLGQSIRRGITLVEVRDQDLSLKALRQKVEGLLPLRSLEGREHLVQYLEAVSRGYRRKARRARGPITSQAAPST